MCCVRDGGMNTESLCLADSPIRNRCVTTDWSSASGCSKSARSVGVSG